MCLRKWIGLTVVLFLLGVSGHAQTKTIAERLGQPADAKLLIVHADDLAVAHSVDAASFDALDEGGVTAASIMVPCPWLNEVAAYAKEHSDADLGLHLTLTSEWKVYRWGPVESKDKITSLLDPSGYLWPETGPAVQNIKAEEAEREIRAQVERAIAAGIHPTHLDSHMGVLFSRPDLFAAYVKVAHEYHLPFLAVRVADERAKLLSLLSEKDAIVDSIIMANPAVHADQWKEFYGKAIKSLKPGLSEMIVHLGHDDSELQAVTIDHPDFGSAWRQRDYDFVTSPEFKKIIEENHIVLVKWRDLQKLLK
ncbi:MAG TPA: polysaccharide deacetylase family protein [Candidatus Acidoferrum sp.]|nr:polysaccharide deacetylase family protein [Candidatus Acidoferrum sp.]